MSKRKLSKVTFEFEDGTIEYLDQSEDCKANEWYEKLNAMAIFMSNRTIDYNWSEHKWKKLSPSQKSNGTE